MSIPFLACFLGALQFVAGNAGKKDAAAKAKIHSSVVLGKAVEMGGFGLKVDLKVEGIEDESLIKAAHEVFLFAWCSFAAFLIDSSDSCTVLSIQPCSQAWHRSERQQGLEFKSPNHLPRLL